MTNEILNGEMLNEEQLDKVVGGTRGELSCDTKLLHALGFMDHFYEPYYCQTHTGEVEAEVNAALAKLPGESKYGASGFSIKANLDGSNSYNVASWLNHDCDRRSMYKMICEAAGKPDFDYKKYL